VPGNEGDFAALDALSGKVIWNLTIGNDSVIASPIQANDGTIYFGTYGGVLWAINPDAGVAKWKYPRSHQKYITT
jgi:outer membrane protein assembly factor BamB